MPDHFFCQTQVGQNPFMPDAACLIVPVALSFGPVACQPHHQTCHRRHHIQYFQSSFSRLRLSLRPNPKRGLLSSRKFCSICILRLYSAIIWCGSRPSALLNSSHGSRALLRCSRCVLAFRPFHDALLPGACADKTVRNRAYVVYGTGHRAPRRPVARRPQAR